VNNTDLLTVSIFGGFPLADIPHVSLSVLALEKRDNTDGENLVNDLCAMAWDRRAEFIFEPEELSESIRQAKSLKQYPVLIADHGDNSGAGGSADDLTVLDEMLTQGLEDIIAGPIWDPVAVNQLIEAGEGTEVSLSIGGKTDVPAIKQIGHGIQCHGTVTKITNGRFILTGPMQTGLEVSLGRSVVLDIGSAQLLICEERWEPYDPGCFTHSGIEPSDHRYILIKSRQHFRAAFESIARHIILAAGPGVCSSDYSQFNFVNLKRPIYPLDRDTEIGHFRTR
jgi:microcystin degradation protein MlrC